VVVSKERISLPSAEDPSVAILLEHREVILAVEVVEYVQVGVEGGRCEEKSVKYRLVFRSQS